jgi:hypothetical protein
LLCNIKVKAIDVTGRGGPQGCETSKLPHLLDNRLTDGGEVVSVTRLPPFTLRKINVNSNLSVSSSDSLKAHNDAN